MTRRHAFASVVGGLTCLVLPSCKFFEHGPSCKDEETACGSTCCAAGVPCGDNTCGCGSTQTLCGDTCCNSDQVCTDGTCYSKQADLWVYMCPDTLQNGCEPSFFDVNNTCTAITNQFQPGSCFDTGITVQGGQSVNISTCNTCPGDCGGVGMYMTPDLFPNGSFYAGAFYCQTECTPAQSCGGAPLPQ